MNHILLQILVTMIYVQAVTMSVLWQRGDMMQRVGRASLFAMLLSAAVWIDNLWFTKLLTVLLLGYASYRQLPSRRGILAAARSSIKLVGLGALGAGLAYIDDTTVILAVTLSALSLTLSRQLLVRLKRFMEDHRRQTIAILSMRASSQVQRQFDVELPDDILRKAG